MCDQQHQQSTQPQPQQQIWSFKHCCSEDDRFFCFDIPEKCPICDRDLRNAAQHHHHHQTNGQPVADNDDDGGHNKDEFIRELKSLPNPLKSANKSKCALAIRPTRGDFLSDYRGNTSDLHICLTMSDGRIVEFDARGSRISQNGDEWQACLVINMFDYLPSKLYNHWDSKLEQFLHDPRWANSEYDPIDNNCFDFVLEFLRSLNMKHFESSLTSKTKFCETFIVPRTKLLARYISLFRKIRSEGLVILAVNK